MIYMFLSVIANYVSLPGAGGTQPTILETFNSNPVNSAGNIIDTSESVEVEQETLTEHLEHINENDRILQNNINNSTINESQIIETSPISIEGATTENSNISTEQRVQSGENIPIAINQEVFVPDAKFESDFGNHSIQITSKNLSKKEKEEDNAKVLDIESHLIETDSLNECGDKSGINIKEVPPAQDELRKPSAIESETSIKTVIEIEPQAPILHKTINTDVNVSATEEPKIEFNDKKNISAEQLLKSNVENNKILNQTEILDKVTLNKKFNSPEAQSALQQTHVYNVKTQVPVNPHIEEKYFKENNSESEKANNFFINPILRSDPHIEEEILTEEELQKKIDTSKEKSQSESITSESPEEDTVPSVEHNKDNKDLSSRLKSPAILRLIEKSLEKDLPIEKKDSQDIETLKIGRTISAEVQPCNNEINVNNTTSSIEDNRVNTKASKKKTVIDTANGNKTEPGINGLTVQSPEEEEAKRSFLESIPQLEETPSVSTKIFQQYQTLREYLERKESSPPPVPLQTYRWEDLRRAKEKGAYPWTHLYKRPLGPDEEPEIVLLLRKSQELRLPSESPKSLKKVRIHEQVLVKETERYISDLSDTEDIDITEEDTKSAQSETTSFSESEEKPTKLNKIKGILKRNRPSKLHLSSTKQNGQTNSSDKRKSEDSPKKAKCCHPIMDKLKTMADKQLKKRHIKKVPLKKDEKIILAEQQKILNLKLSPKAERSEIPHFIEKRDSDEILEDDKLEIVELEESPSKVRKRREQFASEHDGQTSVLIPDEIIEIPQRMEIDTALKPEDVSQSELTPEPTVSEILEEELKAVKTSPPKKSPRKKKEHVYEDIDDDIIGNKIDEILEEAVVSALKQSLASEDQTAIKDLEVIPKLEEIKMGSSEETEEHITHLAPISSIDSTSSDEEKKHLHLAPLIEENDQEDKIQSNNLPEDKDTFEVLKIVEDHENDELSPEIRSVLKREPSPSPSASDKKVTFSHVEDESEPLREDIELPDQFKAPNRWSKISDHEYEAIGQPSEENIRLKASLEKEPSPIAQSIPTVQVSEPMEVDRETTVLSAIDHEAETTKPDLAEDEAAEVEKFQRNMEELYLSSATTTPRTESRTDYIHTSQVDSSAIEELPLKAENRKKGFIANAQDKSRKVQANIKSQAVKIRTKIRGIKKPPTGSPKKERKRLKAPEFSKIKLPEMKFKAPDMSKIKSVEFKKIEFKRPEFTKFNKPDMSKFKIPERLSSLKSKNKIVTLSEATVETVTVTSPESSIQSPKKMFDFNFGTYPRVLRRKKEKVRTRTVTSIDDIPTSSETPPSLDSATIPRGARDKGPVGSRWADKFSEVSYGDNENRKYQRYESSEPESIEPRESSLERKIRENLDRVAKEDEEFGILQTKEQKQFAEFDEENRAIHEISKNRENEFRQRRPMVHQDSDLVSEESKEIGWSEKDIIRNKILKQFEGDHENFASEEVLSESATNTNFETQSTGSSSALRQKGVIEEIDDDEFFLRKRGISQDNIEIRQYISSAIREGFDTPINALAKLGNSQEYYPDEMIISNEQVDYGYDVPPPKPRRIKRYNYEHNTDSAEISQEFDVERKENYDDNISLPQTGSDYFKQLPPNRPLRKPKKQYSDDNQEVPDEEDIPYFDDEQMFFKRTGDMNNLGLSKASKTSYDDDTEVIDQIKNEPPKAPKRRKKQSRESAERDSYLNGFAGRSISNSHLPNGDQQQELTVYRTEHEYVIPLAKPEHFTPIPTPQRRSRSRSRITDDDRTSHGADSLIFNEEENFKVEMKENNGYAVVKKVAPPRPPAPLRRKRSSNSFDQRFATMPQRPKRNYSTIGPSRPPRRKSSTSLGDIKRDASDATQYEELDVDIEDFGPTESPKNLQSGDIISKMKDRPLPPPPRPPREQKKNKCLNDEDDRGGGGEKIIADLQENGDYEIDKSVDKCIEVEASTQTDPLPDDFVCEEFEITDDMKIIEPRRPKTLEDILKEEQEAEFERAKQLVDEENLARGLQRFRESNQRSYSEKSKGSTADRSKASLSRPTTPSAVLIERRVPTPLPYLDQTMVEASLTVLPVDDDEIIEKYESEAAVIKKNLKESEENPKELYEYKLEDLIITHDTGSNFQEKENIIRKLSLAQQQKNVKTEAEFESDLEKKMKIEENIIQDKEESIPELPSPQPPPRRRSSGALVTEQQTGQTELSESVITCTQLLPITELSAAPIQAVTPNRLAITDLEVERLSVHALQAAQITVSHLQGSLINVDDLDCKSGNLVVRNLELPPGLIEEIVERVRSSERPHSQAETQTQEVGNKELTNEEPPARPPPPPQHQVFPSEYMQYSIPPPSFYQLRPPTEDDLQPLQPHRRRRHYRRRDDSSSEEESYRERHRSRQSTRSPEPTIGELGGQLLNACGTSVARAMNQILNYLRTAEKEGTQRSNVSTAIVILILATLAFLLLGISGKNIHHHHWDFFNLPGNDGRDK